MTGLRLLTAGLGRELTKAPATVAALTLSTIVLALALTSGPMFRSTADNALLETSLDGACAFTLGMTASAELAMWPSDVPDDVPAGHTGFIDDLPVLDESAVRAAGALTTPGEMVRTTIGPVLLAATEPDSNRSDQFAVRLFARDGIADEVTLLDGSRSGGVLVASTVSENLGVSPGDTLVVGENDEQTTVTVAGVYQDLTREPRRRSLCSLADEAYGGLDPPPPLMIASPDEAARIGAATFGMAEFRWEVPIATDLGIENATQTAAELQTAIDRLTEDHLLFPGQVREASGTNNVSRLVVAAQRTGSELAPTVDTLSLAGAALAFVLLSVVSWLWAAAVAQERHLLLARGAPAAWLPARLGIAAIVPVTTGLGLGWVGARRLVEWLGPSSVIERSAVTDSTTSLWIAGPVALAVVVVAAAAQRDPASPSGRSRLMEVTGLVSAVAAIAAAYELRTRGPVAAESSTGEVTVDRFAVLFPVLLLVAASAVGAIAIAEVLAIRGRVTSRRPAWFLARRRLAHRRRAVATSFAAAALAVGMLSFGASMLASSQTNAEARARDALGSDTRIAVSGATPTGLPNGATAVRRMTATLRSGGTQPGAGTNRVEVLAVDPATLADAVYWRGDYGRRSAAEVASLLSTTTDARVPVVVLGVDNRHNDAELRLGISGSMSVDVTVVARLPDFPTRSGSVVVIDAASLPESGSIPLGVAEVWARDGVDVPVGPSDVVTTTTDFLEQPTEVTRRWAAGFTLAVAAGFGVLLLVAVASAAQGRRTGALALLLGRMGLSSRGAFGSGLVEIAAPVVAGFVWGTCWALVSAAVVVGPLQSVPGSVGARTSMPAAVIAGVLVATLLAVVGAAWLQHRSTKSGGVSRG